MANFSSGWNFNPAILTELKFCFDYITKFSPGWNISLGVKYEIARDKSQENHNGAENTNRENRRIVSLAVWPLGGDQFSTFWDGNSLQDDGTEAKPVFGCIFLSYKYVFVNKEKKSANCLQARRVHGFPDSLVLFNLVCIEVDVLIPYLSFEIRETMNKILGFIALNPLTESPLLPSGSHIISCFSARAKLIPFRLHEMFSDFHARLAGLKILARVKETGLGFSARAESLST